MLDRSYLLPPTSQHLLDDSARPYFVWWTDITVGELKRCLAKGNPEQRAYWLGTLLREANSRDVWLFTSPAQIREMWPHLLRHLGAARARWAWLLDIEPQDWPPAGANLA